MYQILLSTIAVLPFAHGVAFPGPSPTTVNNPFEKAVIGWTPRTTEAPKQRAVVNLNKRQTEYLSRDPGFCGWVDSGESTVGCPGTGLTCALYTASAGGMAGCCAEGDSQDCGWANSCVNYDAWTKKSCDAECQSNTFVRKCTDMASPYCVTWTYPSDQVADYGCADYNSGVVTVEQSASDLESVYHITLPTYSGLAVTGWDGETSPVDSTPDPTPAATPGSNGSSGSSGSSGNSGNSGNSGSTYKPRPKKKSTPVGAIAGAVVGGLVVLFLIGAAIIFSCVKRRKTKQIANNQNIIAAQQASNPEYKPTVQSPAPMQSPPPQHGYFASQDQKTSYQTNVQVQEQGPVSPMISNPSTPAPPYIQPYYAPLAAPPVPAGGTHEADAIATQGRPVHQPNAYEMGPGK